MTMLTKEQVVGIMSQHAAAIGKTGSGKTYTAKGFVEQLAEAGRRVCVLDPTGAWWGLRSSADGKKAGLPFVIFGGEHGDVAINEHSGPAVAKIIATKNIPAVVDVSGMLLSERKRFVTAFAEVLFQLNRTPLHFVIDEADEFCPQNPQRGDEVMLNRIDRIVRRGRIRGFRVFMITQRPAVLHKNVLTQLNTLIALRLTSPQDRKAIQAWIDGNADAGEAAKVMKTLPGLRIGEGWVWSPENDILIRQSFPRIKTFDSSRTPGDDENIAEPTKLAAVDIAEIRESFAAVEKEAETIDELRARVRELEKVGVPKLDNQEIARRANELCERAESLYGMGMKAHQLAEDVKAALIPMEQQIAGIRLLLDRLVQTDGKAISAGLQSRQQFRERTARDEGRYVDAGPEVRDRVAKLRSELAAHCSDRDLTEGQRALLTACAQTSGGASKTALSLMTGYAKSTRNEYLRQLRAKGLIEENGDVVMPTAAGMKALGDFKPLPTGAALARYWIDNLPAGPARILELLVGRGELTREIVSQLTGFATSTRNEYLRQLFARKLVVTNGSKVAAADMLFD